MKEEEFTVTNYTEHCPHCDSENITMIGDPEYNDEWECDDCKKQFGWFNTKEK
jgi:transposase-like protein